MAERFKFTKARIDNIKPNESARYDVYDTDQPKLALRVYPTGRRVFYLVHRAGGRAGRTTRLSIGAWPDIDLETARKRVRGWLNDYAEGRDPAEVRRADRAKGKTLGDLWTAYLKACKKPRPDGSGRPVKLSWRNDERQYDKHLKRWEGRDLAAIKPADVARLKRKVNSTGGPVAANRVLALLSSMWGWSQDVERRDDWGDLPNPCRGVPRNDETPRNRYLLPDELRRFVAAAEADHDTDVRDAVLLLLFSGQRKATICGLRWDEVDFADRVLRIGAARMKSNRDHMVPMAPRVERILRARQEAVDSELVFPSHGARGHLYDFRGGLKRIADAAGVSPKVTPHDLRRTFATYARELGRDSGPILGHKRQGVTAVYEQETLAGVRETMRAVAAHVEAIVAAGDPGAVVVEFPNVR